MVDSSKTERENRPPGAWARPLGAGKWGRLNMRRWFEHGAVLAAWLGMSMAVQAMKSRNVVHQARCRKKNRL